MRLRTEGDGPLVIKIPGLAGGVGLQHEQIAAARAAGFRVAAVDLPGDRLDDPAPGPLSWDYLANEVYRVLETLDAPRAILWGTSFGALICLAAAARRPQCAAGLLLCSPPLPGASPPLQRALLDWTSSRPLPARSTARHFQLGFSLLNAWEFCAPTALMRAPRLAAATRRASTPNRTVLEKLNLLFRDHPGMPPPEIPCAIIAGRWDTVTSFGAAPRLARMLPGSRLHRLWFCGHACAYSRPAAHNRCVIEELRRMSKMSGVSGGY